MTKETNQATIKTKRVDIDTYFMLMAKVASLRSTCRHRDQGAVIVKNGRTVSTGYNGQPPGAAHCIDIGWCAKTEGFPCRAEGLHAESNAIASAARIGISTDGATIYCVYSPCMACCNLIKSAGIIDVRYLEVYSGFEDGPDYMDSSGIHNEKAKPSEVLSWKIIQA